MVVALRKYFDILMTFWVSQFHQSPAQKHFCWNYQHQNQNCHSWPSCSYPFSFCPDYMIYPPCPSSYLPPNYNNSCLFLTLKLLNQQKPYAPAARLLAFYAINWQDWKKINWETQKPTLNPNWSGHKDYNRPFSNGGVSWWGFWAHKFICFPGLLSFVFFKLDNGLGFLGPSLLAFWLANLRVGFLLLLFAHHFNFLVASSLRVATLVECFFSSCQHLYFVSWVLICEIEGQIIQKKNW